MVYAEYQWGERAPRVGLLDLAGTVAWRCQESEHADALHYTLHYTPGRLFAGIVRSQ